MSFNSLSNEIIIKIIKSLEDNEDLLSVSRTCHLLNTLSAPCLYSLIWQQSNQWCPLFLRTIAARPDLAALVETYIVKEEHDDENSEDDVSEDDASEDDGRRHEKNRLLALRIDDLPEQSVAAMKKVMKEVSVSKEAADEWEGVFFSASPSFDALTAMMIALLPNLQELYMEDYGCLDEHPFIDGVLNHAASLQLNPSFSPDAPSPHSFSQLRMISVRHSDDKRWLEFKCVAPYIRIPSVRKFFGNQIMHSDPILQFSSRLEELELADSLFAPGTFIDLLKNLPLLRKLFCDFRGDIIEDETFSPTALRQGLEACKENLEELSFTGLNSVDYEGNGEEPSSFTDLPKLRRIAVSSYILISPRNIHPNVNGGEIDEVDAFLRRIPRSLSALELTECLDGQFWECVLELVKRKEEIAPDLEMISLKHGIHGEAPRLATAFLL